MAKFRNIKLLNIPPEHYRSIEDVLLKDGCFWHPDSKTKPSLSVNVNIFIDEDGNLTNFNNYMATRSFQYLELNPLLLISAQPDFIIKYPCFSLGGKISDEYFAAKPSICYFNKELALNPEHFYWLGEENLPLGLCPLRDRYQIVETSIKV